MLDWLSSQKKLRKMVFFAILLTLLISMTSKYYPRMYDIELQNDQAIIAYWAPEIYHEVSSESNNTHYQDMITSIDYDGDYDTSNNWENLDYHKDNLPAVVYSWMSQTSDHYYLGYGFYHPRDWSSGSGIIHENDFEGVVFQITKDESQYGSLTSIVTIAHLNMYYFDATAETGLYQNFDNPVIFIDSEGHGVYIRELGRLDVSQNYFIKYIPESSITQNTPVHQLTQAKITDNLTYKVSSIDWYWKQRENRQLYNEYGAFNSDTSGSCGDGSLEGIICLTNMATPPWRWTQGQSYPGEIWFEPSQIFQRFS